MGPHKHCPKCDSAPKDHELRDYDFNWGDGSIYCTLCGEYVRSFSRD